MSDSHSGINLNKSAGTASVNRFGESESVVELSDEMTVEQCLERAGIATPLPQGQSVSVNGVVTSNLSSLVENGAVIVVAGRISNG